MPADCEAAAAFAEAAVPPLESTALEAGPVAQGDALHPKAAKRANTTRVRIRVNPCLGIRERNPPQRLPADEGANHSELHLIQQGKMGRANANCL